MEPEAGSHYRIDDRLRHWGQWIHNDRSFVCVLGSMAALIVAFGAQWALGPEYPYGDDNSAHFSVAVHIAQQIRELNPNLWWHSSNLGVPLFAAYQPLPAVIMGAVIAAFGDWVEPVVLFKASILLCWSLMPLAWGVGGRMFGLSRPAALLLGALTLVVHDPDSIGFGVRSSMFRGLYTQHFGLLFLPLAVGSVWEWVDGKGRSVLHASACFGVLAMSHLWVGLYGVICLVALLLAEPRLLLGRLRRVLPVVVLSAVILAPWLVPLVFTNDYAGGLPWRRQLHEGWHWQSSIGRLVSGEIFDFDRLFVITPLVLLGGLGLVVRSHRVLARRWLVLSVMTTVLFLGRTNLGDLYDLLPLHSQVNVMRYITGVHVCGLLAVAAVGQVVFRWVERRWGVFASSVALMAGLGSLMLLARFEAEPTLKRFDAEQPSFAALVERVSEGPDVRFAVHEQLGSQSHFFRDLLPVLSGRGQLQSYAHGYHCTLSTYYAEYFDFSPAAAELFGVGSVVVKNPVPVSFPTDVWPDRWSNDRYTVLKANTAVDAGLFSFVSIGGAIQGPSLRDLRPAVRFLAVPAYANGSVMLLNVNDELDGIEVVGGRGEVQPWSQRNARGLLESVARRDETPMGEVRSQSRTLNSYFATVVVPEGEDQTLLLKVNAFPWWHATIDGEPTTIRHVAPNFMVIEVPAGIHEVRWEFRNPTAQKWGAVATMIILLFWLVRLTVSSCVRRFVGA